ncbi:MAG: M23 family metallopeptidase [Gammaproteobacteria bacterium]|jgi:murein DD-endopeptidase MepM/ murein hydrolase activator NlpD
MNIILFTNRRGQVWSFEINPVHFVLQLAAGLAIMLAVALYAGTRLGQAGTDYLSDWQDISDWQDTVRSQQSEIAEVRISAQADLDALALRLGQMQAQMLRLNALGTRLVSQGNLDRDEFDFDAEPAVGGPGSAISTASVTYPDFLTMLDELEAGINDREQKLSILETLLMSRSLSERVMPSGRPVEDGWLSSNYGKRNDPFTGKQEFHKGLDFAGKKGSEVIVVGDGVVTWAGKRSGYGNMIEVSHGNGYVTRYGHNQKHLVKVGDTVRKGQQIALMGSTGRSTGPHVHFEVMRDGKTVNPAKYIGD